MITNLGISLRGATADPIETIVWDGDFGGSANFPIDLHWPAGWPGWDASSETGDRGCSLARPYTGNPALRKVYDLKGLGHDTVIDQPKIGTTTIRYGDVY